MIVKLSQCINKAIYDTSQDGTISLIFVSFSVHVNTITKEVHGSAEMTLVFQVLESRSQVQIMKQKNHVFEKTAL